MQTQGFVAHQMIDEKLSCIQINLKAFHILI